MNQKKPIPGLATRVFWTINPRTRIHDNDIRKNHTKIRQSGQKQLKQDWNEYIHRHEA